MWVSINVRECTWIIENCLHHSVLQSGRAEPAIWENIGHETSNKSVRCSQQCNVFCCCCCWWKMHAHTLWLWSKLMQMYDVSIIYRENYSLTWTCNGNTLARISCKVQWNSICKSWNRPTPKWQLSWTECRLENSSKLSSFVQVHSLLSERSTKNVWAPEKTSGCGK